MTRTWISLERAAELLKVKIRHVYRRLKRGDFVTRAGAKSGNRKARCQILLASLPVEAKAKYWAELAARQNGENEEGRLPGSARTLLASQSEEALKRYNDKADAMRRIEKAKNRRKAIHDAAGQFDKSERQIERWYKNFKTFGMASWTRKKRTDAGGSKVTDERVRARIQCAYLQPYRPTVMSIYRETANDYEMSGLQPPSPSIFYRECRKIDPDLVAFARQGEKTFDDKFALVTLRKKPTLPRQWVDADHHIMDHIVIFADGSIGRPWLTAIQDIGTNEILGYLVSHEKKSTYPGSHAIGLTLRKAILKKEDPAWPSFGLFQNFYSDLGKDFRSQHVRAVCHDLDITVRYTRGYHGRSKPIERWFGVLEDGLRRLPGYVGNSTETNPLRQQLGAPRDWKSMRGEIMTVEQFSAALHKWIMLEFHHAESRALKGYSPLGLLEKHIKDGWSAREVTNERALDLLMMSRAGRKVQRMGIQMFSTGYKQRFFMAPELVTLVGQDVQVFWNPEKVGEIIVYKDNRLVCVAQNRELLAFDATEDDVEGDRALKKRQRDSLRERLEEQQKQAQYPNELERVQAEKRMESTLAKEREKIAVNATAPAASVLIPKFHRAAKALRAVQDSRSESDISRKGAKAQRAESAADENPWMKDELKSSDELFKQEDKPEWQRAMEREEYERLNNCSHCKIAVNVINRSSCRYCRAVFCSECAGSHECEKKPAIIDFDE